jgi:hypothetical protein
MTRVLFGNEKQEMTVTKEKIYITLCSHLNLRAARLQEKSFIATSVQEEKERKIQKQSYNKKLTPNK